MSDRQRKKKRTKPKGGSNEPPLFQDGDDNTNMNVFQLVVAEVEKGPVLNPTDFDTLNVLGDGGFGIVTRVKHTPTGVEMAQKEIRFHTDAQIAKQICIELMILRSSNCPAIVQFHGSAFMGDKVYIYMELMDTSINNLKKSITEEFLKKVAKAVLSATYYLKSQLKIMHRDLKPSNILVNSKGEIKLCDFGISGELVDSLAKTYQGSAIYMAPERVDPRTSGNAYSTKSDVWSLGVTLLELGNGAHPFAANEMLSSLTKILNESIPPLKSTYSAAAQAFVARCLLRDIKDRPDYHDLLQDPWIQD
jgi:serine/threonine protein kinase